MNHESSQISMRHGHGRRVPSDDWSYTTLFSLFYPVHVGILQFSRFTWARSRGLEPYLAEPHVGEHGLVPGYGTMATPPWVHHLCHAPPGHVIRPLRVIRECAMGSYGTLRNSQIGPQVIPSQTIWALAPDSKPCCKNQVVQKAPGYLALSIPPKILSRLRTLP